eukprot:12714216-Heterocapsa_arctica.AAC.1
MGEKEESEELEARCMPILVIRDHRARWISSHVVPSKGIQRPWPARVLGRDLKLSGYGSFLFKSDQEESIRALKREG